MIAVTLLGLISVALPVYADGNPLNGSSRRPFYIFAHNPNTLADAKAALSAGANALEPDVQIGAPGELVIAHNANESGKIRLEDYLDGLHDLAFQYEIAAVVFDVKPEAASPANGLKMLQAIRDHLNTRGINLCVVLSVADRKDGALFDGIIGPNAKTQLLSREGVQVDEEDDCGAVVNYFFSKGYHGNIGFGDGTLGPGPHLPTAMDGAVWNRAAFGYPKAVTYVYTINRAESMKLFLDAGVDGIITDDLSQLVKIVHARTDIFSATRKDNLFAPVNEAYALLVRTTTDVDGAGTDAHITFTLTGTLGSAAITVDTEPSGRMEEGSTNHVTLPSKDLGPLKSITVSNDGHGKAPDWHLQDITVYSAHWLRPDPLYHYTAALNDWLPSGGTRTLSFRNDEYVWAGTTATSEGTIASPWKRLKDAYTAAAPAGTIYVSPGNYKENLRFSKPCTLEFSAKHGSGSAIIGGMR